MLLCVDAVSARNGGLFGLAGRRDALVYVARDGAAGRPIAAARAGVPLATARRAKLGVELPGVGFVTVALDGAAVARTGVRATGAMTGGGAATRS